MTEIDDLTVDFDQQREQRADNIHWDEEDEALFEEDMDDVSEAKSSSFTKRHLGILHHVFTGETKALPLRVMGPHHHYEPAALARKESDAGILPEDTSVRVTAMPRTDAESDASFTENDPATKTKIREWSLQYLKDSAVEKCSYRNVLEEFGVSDLVASDWQGIAEEYWDRDSLSETGDFVENYEPSIHGTSHTVHPQNDVSNNKQCYTALSSPQDTSDCENRHPEKRGRKSMSIAISFSDSDYPWLISLPPSPLVNSVSERTLEPVVPEDGVSLNRNGKPKSPNSNEFNTNHGATKKPSAPFLVRLFNESERKDSVISEHQKQAGQKADLARVQNIQETQSGSKIHNHTLHFGKLKPTSISSCKKKKELPTDRAFSEPSLYKPISNVHEEATFSAPLSAINTTGYEPQKANRRMQILSKSVSDRWIETMSRTRRIWGLFPRNKLKRSRTTPGYD
ncbi:hypothetical protein PtrSN002B_007296 [Pyrenophora tritici-repentis]|nr:hypothetical protein PtrV1_02654 [Pyrenophora tritici-repentis]KAF7455394.1 hypothetical protein A1F99_026520 [Pyrenophora tritici-repentis]KAF7578581.1 hypothetical protein PtrM4_028210 [Pyrenophora tritici-repentis]KAG9389137.1 hypothetical protein A1F94_002030 [Pyrenophora tritici-repentis]KAI0575464.1 hypothetical protein Alg215_08014 [Pyrenophora tritici-repentis]